MCRQWIRIHAQPTKTIRRRRSSYGLKHAVEAWTRNGTQYEQVDASGRRWKSDYLYIANGAFIEAARLEGYGIERASSGSPNAFFNMTFPKRRA